jgi:predicted transcriptional regulator
MAEITIRLPDDLAARVRSHVDKQGGNLDGFVSDTMAERLDELETAASVRRGLEDAAAGRIRPAREAIRQLAQSLGLTLKGPIG